MYRIIKVNKYFQRGAAVTAERTVKRDGTLEEVKALAARQGADMDEIMKELETMGITSFKGYMISEEG